MGPSVHSPWRPKASSGAGCEHQHLAGRETSVPPAPSCANTTAAVHSAAPAAFCLLQAWVILIFPSLSPRPGCCELRQADCSPLAEELVAELRPLCHSWCPGFPAAHFSKTTEIQLGQEASTSNSLLHLQWVWAEGFLKALRRSRCPGGDLGPLGGQWHKGSSSDKSATQPAAEGSGQLWHGCRASLKKLVSSSRARL